MVEHATMFVLTVVIICAVLPMCHCGVTRECQALKNMATQASNRYIPGIQMFCKANKACTGVNCNGDFNMAKYKVNTDFCFGFEIQNCLKPTKVDVYTYLPKSHISYEERVGNNDQKEIPGATINLRLIKVDPFVNITLKDKPNNVILFGIGIFFRITDITGSEHFPRSLRYVLLPPTEIPVTPCKTNSTMAPPVDNKCLVPEPTGTVPATVPTPTKKHTGPRPAPSATYNKPCSQDSLYECGENEVCSKNTSTCQCASLAKFDPWSRHCIGENPHSNPSVLVTTTTVSPNHTRSIPSKNDTQVQPTVHSNKGGSSKHKTIVIASCTVAAVVLVAGLVITAFVFIRKRRARYADHDILLQNDDDTTDNVI